MQKRFAQNRAGSIPIGTPMSCFSVMFPTMKKQFSINCLTAVFSEFQANLIQSSTFLPKEAFPLALFLSTGTKANLV